MKIKKALIVIGVLFIPIMSFGQKNNMIEIKSNHSFAETVSRLESIIKNKGLNVFATIDHTKGAEKAGLELKPTTLIIFGNPKVGTLLMQADQSMGIELPLKYLIIENEKNEVLIRYKNPEDFSDQYTLEDRAEIIGNVKKALAGISNAAAS